MTRLLSLLAVLAVSSVSTSAYGQTYVRPSKGAPVKVLSAILAGTGSGTTASPVYDFTSFAAVQVLVQDSVTLAPIAGPWEVNNLPPYVQFIYSQPSGFGIPAKVTVKGGVNKTGPLAELDIPNGSYSFDYSPATKFDVVATGIPFGAQAAVSGLYPTQTFIQNEDLFPVILGGTFKSAGAGDATPQVRSVGVDGSGLTAGGGSALNVHLTGYGFANQAGFSLPVTVSQPVTVSGPIAVEPETYNYVSTANSPKALSQAPNTPPAGVFTCLGDNVFTASSTQHNVRLQVVSNTAVVCAWGSCPIVTTRAAFALSAASATGLGGTIDLKGVQSGTLYCSGVNAAASIHIMPY